MFHLFKENLVIINNEKCIREKDKTYCENIEIKSISELLSKSFNVKLILRKAKVAPVHEIKNSEINISPNIFSFIKSLIVSIVRDKAKYLIISVTPYTFLSFLLLLFFRKKIFLYLRSDGKKEISVIFGKILSTVYKIVENLMANFSTLIVVNDLISTKKNFHLVNPSQIDNQWFENLKKINRENIRLLYIGRIKTEKGVYSLINIFKKLKSKEKKILLTIIGPGDKFEDKTEGIAFLDPISSKKQLIDHYDQNHIFVLPSYTEGHPQVLIESLSRKRPVIVFEEIKHISKKYEGVFVCKRDHNHFLNLIKFIDKNYEEILEKMKKNRYPTKENFFKQLNKIFN